jgi:hypothetical protein
MGAYLLVARRAGSVELSTVTRAELYARARQLGVPGRSRMNKEELARAVRERGWQLVQARAGKRRSSLWAATPAVLRRRPAWSSYRMVAPLAGVMLSAAIGATTPMVLVDSSGERAPMTRVGVSGANLQAAPVEPRPAPVAASAPAHRGAPSWRRAVPAILLAEASGDPSTRMGSASQPVDKGTETPAGDSGPPPSGPQATEGPAGAHGLAGDDDEPGGDPNDPGGSHGAPGDGDGLGEESAPGEGEGSDDGSDGGAAEDGKGKDKDQARDNKDKGKGKDKGSDNGSDGGAAEDGKGKDKDKDKDKGKGKDKDKGKNDKDKRKDNG